MFFYVSLAFQLWLRPTEALSARWSDLVLRGDLGAAGVFKVRNPMVKSGHAQHVASESHLWATVWLCLASMRPRHPDSFVMPVSLITLHQKCQCALLAVGVRHVSLRCTELAFGHFTPGGLRTAGATMDFLEKERIDRVLWRGRWVSIPVLKHYLQMFFFI